MTREDPQFKLRVPQELRDAIEKSAKLNNRSMNAEIVARLQDAYFGHVGQFDPKYIEERLAYLTEQVEMLKNK